MVVDTANTGKKGWETKVMTKVFRLKKQKEETWVEHQTGMSIMARKVWENMKLPFLYENISESMWHAMGWLCDEKTNAVIDSLMEVNKWRCTTWWQSLHTSTMKEDPENRTRWKHKWEVAQSRDVWDKMATCWAGKKDWMTARKERNWLEDKYKFITYILNKMNFPSEHRQTENKDKDKKIMKKTQRFGSRRHHCHVVRELRYNCVETAM